MFIPNLYNIEENGGVNRMRDETIKAVGAQICITVLAIFALANGQNGVILGMALGSLANLGGFFQAKKKE